MERLRAAIEQARKTRAEAGTPIAPSGSAANVKVVEPSSADASPIAAGVIDERWAELPEIKLQPRRMRKNRLVFESNNGEQAPFDLLRTRLLTQMRKNDWRRVAVTSPDMACGKSTTCANLALAMSRQNDLRTVVLEADMRRPSLAKMFGLKGEYSFADVLSGNVGITEQASRIGSNVALSVNFGSVKDPTSLLHSRQTKDVLEEIEDTLQPDLVIFDMPPLLSSDDTLGFIDNVDCALIIAMAERTTAENIDLCETELAAHTNVAGVVLNRCRYGQGQYGYGYGYGES